MEYMQLRSAHGDRFVFCGGINGSIKIMVLQIAQHTKFCSEFWNFLRENNYFPRLYRFRYGRTARVVWEFMTYVS